jgi:ATP phosphoribosyltransferase regulatory subunit|tara:strand:- start:1434 stop:2636 length:1203 start_codon:yes stop_codon:yes gene_type:complete
MNNQPINSWLLPDGVQETLPPAAFGVDLLRRQVLQMYHSWGYDLVMPAMIEFMDSLLTGTAHSLDTKTFSLVDQMTGKQMGVRSDMTPQVARIDAHLLADDDRKVRIERLCYCGHLLHAQADGITSSRTPLQIGAEIFGNTSVTADVEVVSLMIETLHTVGLKDISIDLGHVGIFRSLVSITELDDQQEAILFDMLQRKSIPELEVYLSELDLPENLRAQFNQLALLNGDIKILQEARQIFKGCHQELDEALDRIQSVIEVVQDKYPGTLINCDLAELRGYNYHTGLVFAAFLPGQGKEIARGGRYDNIGAIFGNARPATGFSADLLNLHQLSDIPQIKTFGILAPNNSDAALNQVIQDLRSQGQRVIVDLTEGKSEPAEQKCDKILIRQDNGWTISEAI